MKLIQLGAAALITLSSLTAQAGLLLDGTGATVNIVSPNNEFKRLNNVTAPTFNVGGNLLSDYASPFTLEFSYLGMEASYRNKFEIGSNMINNYGATTSFQVTYGAGDDIEFSFSTAALPAATRTVVNGGNNAGDLTVSFATLLAGQFNLIDYDAILFFDDTGGRWTDQFGVVHDDDNHDDLAIGVRVVQVPESSTLVLMMMGLLGLFGARRLKS